jgi:phage terminase Nu1 subunit (DNA packaging protein)
MKQKELADLFSASVGSIKKWAAEGFPINSDLKKQIAWVRENRPIASDTITEARRRKITV